MCGWALAGCWWNLFISFDVRKMRWCIASVKPITVINRWSNMRAWIATCCEGWLLQLRIRYPETVLEQLFQMRTFFSACFLIACELIRTGDVLASDSCPKCGNIPRMMSLLRSNVSHFKFARINASFDIFIPNNSFCDRRTHLFTFGSSFRWRCFATKCWQRRRWLPSAWAV